MYEKFKVVGLSYRKSPLEMREMVSLTESETHVLLGTLKEVLGLEEAMIISTCNRTEIYYSHEQSFKNQIISLLFVQKGAIQSDEIKSYFEERVGDDAIEHLYRVSLGLDAKVLGDIQISNQIKRAYQASADEVMAGPFLHRIMHSIFYANKRVVQETAFRDGAASTSYASVDISEQFIANFKEARILVLGLGEIGTDVAGNLLDVKAKVTVANRTYEKAEEIAEKYNYDIMQYEQALQALTDFDVIISSVAVKQPVICRSNFNDSRISLKLLIDLSVPRSIDQDVESMPGFILYNIDQIEQKTNKIHQQREDAIPQVEAIMNESINDLENWAQEMEVSPVIKKLKQALEDIRQEEMSRYLKNADEKQAELLDKMTKSMLQKVIKLPVLQLKAACKRGEAETLVDVLNDLFNLEKDASQKAVKASNSSQQ